MAADVFISHSSKDIKVAETICAALESRGSSCWISSRDVDAGENFADAIVDAIAAAKVMLLVFSANANNSGEIKKELVVASHSRTIVVPVRVEDVVPSGAMRYELATRQWIDLFADWEREVDRLARRIQAIVAAKRAGVDDADLGTRGSVAGSAPDVILAADGELPGGRAAGLFAGQADTGEPAAARFVDDWAPAAPARLLAVEPRATSATGEGTSVARVPAKFRLPPMLVLAAAACLAAAIVAAIVFTRSTPAPIVSKPVPTGPGKGETVGYVADLDPYGDNYLSLRTGPGTEYPEIYRMGENTFVHVVATAGKWTQVRLNGGQIGWAYSQYLRPGYPR